VYCGGRFNCFTDVKVNDDDTITCKGETSSDYSDNRRVIITFDKNLNILRRNVTNI